MASVAFTYNGSNTVTATITDATPAQVYSLVVQDGDVYPDDSDTAVGTTLVLSVNTASPSAGFRFSVFVQEGTPFQAGQDFIAATCFQQGVTNEYEFPATWAFDGSDEITVTGVFENGIDYILQTLDATNGGSNTPFTGTGASQIVTHTTPTPAGGAFFYAEVQKDVVWEIPTVRLFTAGVAGDGDPGNPTGAETELAGINIAFDDPVLTSEPVWTRIDETVRVSRWEIRRGRQSELEKTGTATATIFVNDVDGFLDAGNAGGPWFGKLDGKQVSISRWNPVTESWSQRFRGYIEEYSYDLKPSQVNTEVAIHCVGFMDYLAGAEMAPGQAGSLPPPDSEGNIFYEDAEVDDRLLAILADAGFPTDLAVIFSGNVVVQESIYDPGYSFLAALQDAADAEFPGVANLYEDRLGRIVFHGRHARFDPDTVALEAGADAWDFQRWLAGDGGAIALDADTAQVRPPVSYDRSLKLVINAALVTPLGIAESDIEAQLSTDATSITNFGVRSWSAQDLRILEHKTNGNTALQEAKLMADYYVTNYSEPRTRPRQVTFKPLLPSDPRAEPTWALLTRVDISDVIQLLVTSPGGGGLDLECYVEGITETCYPGGPDFAFGEVTLDVSPTAWYETDVFNDS